MGVVKLAAELQLEEAGGSRIEALEALAEVYQLADAIHGKAARKLQKLYEKETKSITSSATRTATGLQGKGYDEGLVDSFLEIAASLGT